MDTAHEAHDRLVNHLFLSGLTLAAVRDLQQVEHDIGDRIRDVVEELDVAIREIHHIAFAAVASERQRSQLRPAPMSKAALGLDRCR
jgi:hypothetical protein